MKHFSLGLHIVLAIVAIGLAHGAQAEGLRPMIVHGLIGLAIGLSFTAIARLFLAL